MAKDEAVSADEAAADGIKWTFNPMVDISRDPRWGRVVEGAGEDPFLGSAIAAAKVRGYQGRDFSAPDKVAATIKHFGAYGAPVAGREYNTVDMSTQQLFNDYLPPYKAAVDAGAATVMSSFNSLNGVPNTANPYLLTTILRDEWGFGGTTLSDYQAVQELEDFGYAADGADAARLALTAGENIEMAVKIGSTPGHPIVLHLRDLRAVAAALGQDHHEAAQRCRAPRADSQVPGRDVRNPNQGSDNRVAHEELTPANLAAARKTADESMVLLNNNKHALPLSTEHRQGRGRRAAGRRRARSARSRRADRLRPDPDGQSKDKDQIVTVRDGITNVVGSGRVNYAPGCTTFTVADPCNDDDRVRRRGRRRARPPT